MVFLRFLILGFFGLTILYLTLTIILRSRHRRWLERRHDDHVSVEQGMAEYQRGLRRWLPVLVYVVPSAVFGAVVWWMNNE